MPQEQLPIEQKESEQEIFAVSDLLSVRFIKDATPENDSPAENFVVILKTSEGTRTFPYTDVLPEGVTIRVQDSEALEFGYDHKSKILTTNKRWFEKDPEVAFLMTSHEGGHAIDATKEDKTKLYVKDDWDVSNEELASMERGVDDGIKDILTHIKTKHGEHGIPERDTEKFIVGHLLGYQVGVVFDEKTTEPPRFLHVRYDGGAWKNRFHILEETALNMKEKLSEPTKSLFARLKTSETTNTGTVRDMFMETFGGTPYLSFALPHNQTLFENLERAVTLTDFMGGGFEAFEKEIKETLLHTKLGVVPFIAHEKLLVEESKPMVELVQ